MRRFPHTYVLLLALVAVAVLLTHLIPAGSFARVEQDGRRLVVPGSYQSQPSHPAGIGDLFLAWPKGLGSTASIVFYIFLIGGTFGVINATGAIDASIGAVVSAGRGRGPWVLTILMLAFSIGGGTIGMAEETLPFIPALVLLARRLGYDEVTGCAIALVGAGAGFSGAFLNPFTVGVGQGIAGVPLFSGIGFRLVVWVVVTAIAIAYVLRYAHRVRRDPASEPSDAATHVRLTTRHRAVLLVLIAALIAVVIGAMRWNWGLDQLAALFVAAAALCGWAGGLGANDTAERFIEGAAGIAGGALVVGLARGVLVIFDGAGITDTLLDKMAGAVAGLPAWASVLGIYGVQVSLSYIVPSGSGQAALALPILVPLADMVGVTRQTSVLAYQFGDGFSNILTPTQGYFMAALALAKIPFATWARFVFPLQLIWLVAGGVLLLIAHAIGWS
ncbi:MAG: AbgT family transporter [Acidobacteriota bacterium]